MKFAVKLLCLVLLSYLPLTAQEVAARLSGTVTDQNGGVVPGATVTVTNQATGVSESQNADSQGTYVFHDLQPGTYDLKAASTGFDTINATGLLLRVGQELSYNLTLHVGRVQTSVSVSVETPVVEPDKGQVDTVITHKELEDLPTNTRYFMDLAYLTPGVSVNQGGGGLGEEISVNGQRGYANSYNVDGVNDQESYLQDVRTAISEDDIQEFQVITHQMEPQYGDANGAVINVVTRGGTNQFHGTGYGFFRNSIFDAEDAIDKAYGNPKPPTHRNLAGGTFGGPIIHNKLFFFGSYEGSSNVVYGTITAPQQAGQTVAGGPLLQIYSGRADYTSGSNQFTFRYNGENQSTFEQAGGVYTLSTEYTDEYKTNEGAFLWTRTFTPHILGEFRAQVSTVSDSGVPVTTSGPEVVRPSSISGKLSSLPYNVPEQTGQIAYNLSATKGAHDLKFGFDYLRINLDGSNENFGNGIYYFNTDAAYNPADPSTYPYRYYQRIGPDSFHIPENLFGWFAQDKWSLTKNLVVTYGLRWDYDNFFNQVPAAGTLGAYIPPGGTGRPIANPTNLYAPRVSVAYNPFKKTVFRGGAGMFYGRIPTNEAALVVINTVNTLQGAILNDITEPIPYPTPPSLAAIPINSKDIDVLDNSLKLPHTTQYTAGVQQDLGRGYLLQVDFVRALGHDLWTYINRNAPDPTTGIYMNPNYQNITAQASIGSSWYSAMEVTFKHHGSKNDFTAAYTLSKAIDDVKGDPNAQGVTCSYAIDYNPAAINCDRGPADNDVRNRLVATDTVTLPWNFTFSTILTAFGGVPYSALDPGLDCDGYFNCYAPGYSRNSLRTDSYFSWDARVGKKFYINERVMAWLFVEGFNLTNKANYNSYIGDITSSQFMQPTGVSDPRRLQFGFRVAF